MFAALWSTVYSCITVYDMKLCNKLKYHFNYIVFCFYVKPSQHHNSKLAWLYKWPRNFNGSERSYMFFSNQSLGISMAPKGAMTFSKQVLSYLGRKLSLRSKAYNQPKRVAMMRLASHHKR